MLVDLGRRRRALIPFGLAGRYIGAVLACAGAAAVAADVSVLTPQAFAAVSGVDWRPCRPKSAGIALAFDRPWEGPFAGAVSVVSDGRSHRIYYRGAGIDARGDYDPASEVVCVAFSPDGIQWTKPDLRLHRKKESPGNNIVLVTDARRAAANFAVAYDPRPGVPADERYKAVGGVAGLHRYVSADGLRWRPLAEPPLFGDLPLGAHSLQVDPASGECVLYLRLKPSHLTGDAPRPVMRAVSRDFRAWSGPAPVMIADHEDYLYTFPVVADPRQPSLRFGLPLRVLSDRQVLAPAVLDAIGAHPLVRTAGVSDTPLLVSDDGLNFRRPFRGAYVWPGPARENWIGRSNILAAGLVATSLDEVSLYVQRGYTSPGARLERVTLRRGRWGALVAEAAGQAVTPPFVWTATNLTVNVATSAAGAVRIAVLDEAGRDYPGYGDTDAREITGDGGHLTVTWRENRSLASLRGRVVRLKFSLKEAELYGYSTSDPVAADGGTEDVRFR